MPVATVFSKFRLERARRRANANAATGKSRSTGLGLGNYLVMAAIWAAGIYMMGRGDMAQSLVGYAMNGVTLIVLGLCGQQLLRIVAPNAASMKTYWSLMIAMLIIALAEVRFYDYAYARLVLPFLPAGSGAGSRMFAYPNAVVPFLVALLYGGPAALVIGVITSAAISVSAGNAFNLDAYIVALCATCVIAHEAPKIAHRRQMSSIVFRVGALQLFILAIILYRQAGQGMGLVQILFQACAFYACLVVSVLLFTFILLPAAEFLTKRVSNIGVGRLADLESPLLRRLSLEAPGTYHHAMMVGDLAQTAAEAIGANGVLARVGAYYHDIGKLSNPHYYMENQSGIDNPHDALPPNISRMVIMNHVKEGLVLAKLGHLPPVLSRFIATHHGTSIARWFLMKEQKRLAARGAKAERNDDPSNEFRYPGPLPVTREETIVSLADSIEAASRSMRFFDRAKIEGLVDSILQDRWIDGQLAESELTGAELARVRTSFVSTLVHLLHGRLPYPSQK